MHWKGLEKLWKETHSARQMIDLYRAIFVYAFLLRTHMCGRVFAWIHARAMYIGNVYVLHLPFYSQVIIRFLNEACHNQPTQNALDGYTILWIFHGKFHSTHSFDLNLFKYYRVQLHEIMPSFVSCNEHKQPNELQKLNTTTTATAISINSSNNGNLDLCTNNAQHLQLVPVILASYNANAGWQFRHKYTYTHTHNATHIHLHNQFVFVFV